MFGVEHVLVLDYKDDRYVERLTDGYQTQWNIGKSIITICAHEVKEKEGNISTTKAFKHRCRNAANRTIVSTIRAYFTTLHESQ